MNSISDRVDYKNICNLAANNENEFENFKTNIHYNGILEHVSMEQGLLYLNNLKINNPLFIEKLTQYKENDKFGNPKLSQYPEIGEISPTTLRYIKVASDIKKLFGDLTGKKIIEIGVGYGGQCLILNKEFEFNEYALVDLDETLQLNNKYLTKHNIKHRLIKIEDVKNLDEDFDLVISNYAYSELTKELQDLYYEKIIKKAKHGYFTLNFISHLFNIDSYNLNELLVMFGNKSCKIMEEIPSTYENNKILYF